MADSGCMLNGANYFNEEFFIYRMSKLGGGSLFREIYIQENLSQGESFCLPSAGLVHLFTIETIVCPVLRKERLCSYMRFLKPLVNFNQLTVISYFEWKFTASNTISCFPFK